MNGLFEAFKKLLGIAIAGAVGASVVVMALSDTDLIGAAAGKRAPKKNRGSNLVSDALNELNKKPQPTATPTQQQNNPNLDLNVPVGLPPAIDDYPLMDPVECANSVRELANTAIYNELLVKGEVRAFHHELGNTEGAVCYVEVLPNGCNETKRYQVYANFGLLPSEHAIAADICTVLSNAAFAGKTIYLYSEKYLAHESFPTEQNLIRQVSFMRQNMDTFQTMVEEANRKRDEIAKRLGNAGNSINDTISKGIGAALGHTK